MELASRPFQRAFNRVIMPLSVTKLEKKIILILVTLIVLGLIGQAVL